MLRAKQIGLSLEELDVLSVGEVIDMIIESQNDTFKYNKMATQDDINRLFS